MRQQSPRLTATIIWAALLAGATMFMGVALYIVFGLRGGVGVSAPVDAERELIGASLALSVVTVAVSWLWAVRMAVPAQGNVARRGRGAIPPGPEADAVTRLIVACALCEGSALAATVVFLQTGNALALASYALSWLALAAHFPGDRHWAQLTGFRAAAGRNPMIRG
jgi:hypothetical protein